MASSIRESEVEIDAIKKELEDLPEGHLAMYGQCYYEVCGAARKGITKDVSKIRLLARKAYLMQRLRNLEHNLLLAKKMALRYTTEEPVEILRELSASYQGLPGEYFFYSSIPDTCELLSVGYDDPLFSNPYHPESLTYVTSSGLRVRSKSERTIAEMLDKYGINYRYEAGLILDGAIKYPDFSIKRPVDGRFFVWEHFGLMDDAAYRHKVAEKLGQYFRHGFLPGVNLLCSYEKDMKDNKSIRALIEIYLLP